MVTFLKSRHMPGKKQSLTGGSFPLNLFTSVSFDVLIFNENDVIFLSCYGQGHCTIAFRSLIFPARKSQSS